MRCNRWIISIYKINLIIDKKNNFSQVLEKRLVAKITLRESLFLSYSMPNFWTKVYSEAATGKERSVLSPVRAITSSYNFLEVQEHERRKEEESIISDCGLHNGPLE